MPDESDIRAYEDQTLTVPGVLGVGPFASGPIGEKKRVRTGAAAGWMVPRGIMGWERELSFVLRKDATPELASALRATLPHEQIAPKKYAMAARAAEASPLLPVASNLVPEVRAQGVRVHTVGVDRVSAGFFYFAEGGAGEALRVQGNLVEMLAPSLTPTTTNAEIETLLDGLIERLLFVLSDGAVSELDVELADALPRISRDGSGLAGTNLDAFDSTARSLALQSSPWEAPARKLFRVVESARREGLETVSVPLYGEARREVRDALDVQVSGKTLHLPEQTLWVVTGSPREEIAAVTDSLAPAGVPSEAAASVLPVAAVVPDAMVAIPPAALLPQIEGAAPLVIGATEATIPIGATDVTEPGPSAEKPRPIKSVPPMELPRKVPRASDPPIRPSVPTPQAMTPAPASVPPASPAMAAAPSATAQARHVAEALPANADAPAQPSSAPSAQPAPALPLGEPAAASPFVPSAEPGPRLPAETALVPVTPPSVVVEPDSESGTEPDSEPHAGAARSGGAGKLAKKGSIPNSVWILLVVLIYFVLRRLHVLP